MTALTLEEAARVVGVPEPGQLVRVRGRHWVVADVSRSALADENGEAAQHLVTVTSVEDDQYDETIRVIWEIEPGARVLERATLPTPDPERFDDPDRLAAFLDAIRWGAVTSADSQALQSPFRSGIAIEDYQLDPVVRGLRMPRVNLLIADDVGLGKTIEAGLVAQELLLRHRARSVMIVCPASLCEKWRVEMVEKFGLEFRIVNAELLRHLRRTRGLRANPWTHFPRLIVSVDWLKRDRPMKLLREVLPPVPTYPRKFDLLIVDEVHNVAPSGRGKYATDSQRTRAIRLLAPHFEHRLFLSATPHNGYRESWTALLELLDPQRFARNVEPDEAQLRQILVRRLKKELPPNPDGSPRFPEREIEAITVDYPDDERAAHAALNRFAELRAKRAESADEGDRMATEFVLKLLKKRLFSSPPAFARTLDVYERHRSRTKRAKRAAPSVKVLAAAVARTEDEESDESVLEATVEDAVATATELEVDVAAEEQEALGELRDWAAKASGRADAKAWALLTFLDDVVRPTNEQGEREWGDERVIVFTEYRDTQRFLADLLVGHGLGGERLALLYGGMDEAAREHTKAVFQADPEVDPVRILLATDAASEGIDLQRHCHRVVHYEIPWNPNRLEQRNGRVDRFGQHASKVLVHHFVGSHYEDAEPGSIEDDLEFLSKVAVKVETIREDLGSAGDVLAAQVEERMLGRRRSLDDSTIEQARPRGQLRRLERDLSERIERLRERLDETIRELDLTPAAVQRVVDVALALAHQPPLEAVVLERSDGSVSAFALPQLTGTWARATEGLAHPALPEVIRPITFDHEVAADHDDVVLAHLGHRLVAQSLWLLRAEIWAPVDGRLSRVAARVVGDDVTDETVVLAHGRLVITGADGHRLHEEIVTAGGHVRAGRFGRIPQVGRIDELRATPSLGIPLSGVLRELAETWPRLVDPVLNALERRSRDRATALDTVLGRRADEDEQSARQVLEELERNIRGHLDELDAEYQPQLPGFARDEREQYERDKESLIARLDTIPAEIERTTAELRRRYAEPTPRLFPAAIEFLVPERLASAR